MGKQNWIIPKFKKSDGGRPQEAPIVLYPVNEELLSPIEQRFFLGVEKDYGVMREAVSAITNGSITSSHLTKSFHFHLANPRASLRNLLRPQVEKDITQGTLSPQAGAEIIRVLNLLYVNQDIDKKIFLLDLNKKETQTLIQSFCTEHAKMEESREYFETRIPEFMPKAYYPTTIVKKIDQEKLFQQLAQGRLSYHTPIFRSAEELQLFSSHIEAMFNIPFPQDFKSLDSKDRPGMRGAKAAWPVFFDRIRQHEERQWTIYKPPLPEPSVKPFEFIPTADILIELGGEGKAGPVSQLLQGDLPDAIFPDPYMLRPALAALYTISEQKHTKGKPSQAKAFLRALDNVSYLNPSTAINVWDIKQLLLSPPNIARAAEALDLGQAFEKAIPKQSRAAYSELHKAFSRDQAALKGFINPATCRLGYEYVKELTSGDPYATLLVVALLGDKERAKAFAKRFITEPVPNGQTPQEFINDILHPPPAPLQETPPPAEPPKPDMLEWAKQHIEQSQSATIAVSRHDGNLVMQHETMPECRFDFPEDGKRAQFKIEYAAFAQEVKAYETQLQHCLDQGFTVNREKSPPELQHPKLQAPIALSMETRYAPLMAAEAALSQLAHVNSKEEAASPVGSGVSHPLSEHEKTVLVADASMLCRLQATRTPGPGGVKRYWSDLLEETAQLDNVQALVVPSIIADWEMQGQISRMHANGQTEIQHIRDKEHGWSPATDRHSKLGREFFKDASRARLDKDGNLQIVYGKKRKLIIWETPEDQQRVYDKIRDVMKDPHIPNSYERRNQIQALNFKNEGELAIERFIREIPWSSPTFVLSSDINYLNDRQQIARENGMHRFSTGKGFPAGDLNLEAYLQAEGRIRSHWLQQKMGEPEAVGHALVIRDIIAHEKDVEHRSYKTASAFGLPGEPDTQKLQLRGKVESFTQMITRGYMLHYKEHIDGRIAIPPAPQYKAREPTGHTPPHGTPACNPVGHFTTMVSPAHQAAQSSDSTEPLYLPLGKYLDTLMKGAKLQPETLAERINACCESPLAPSEKQITAQTIKDTLAGHHKPSPGMMARLTHVLLKEGVDKAGCEAMTSEYHKAHLPSTERQLTYEVQ